MTEEKDEWDEKVDKIDIMKLHLWVFEESKFPLHLRHLLENNNIKTIGDLVQKSEQDLLKLRQFGLKRLHYVNLTLEGIGLSLRIEETDEERDYRRYCEWYDASKTNDQKNIRRIRWGEDCVNEAVNQIDKEDV